MIADKIKKWKVCLEDYEKYGHDQSAAIAKTILSDLKELQEVQESKGLQWVKVEDDLPKVGEYVLVILYGNTWLKGMRLYDGWKIFYSDGENYLPTTTKNVTHWSYLQMPLEEFSHPQERAKFKKELASEYYNPEQQRVFLSGWNACEAYLKGEEHPSPSLHQETKKEVVEEKTKYLLITGDSPFIEKGTVVKCFSETENDYFFVHPKKGNVLIISKSSAKPHQETKDINPLK